MKIVEYVSADNVLVEFQDDYKYRKRTIYQNFKIGQIKNPYDKSVHGVGCIGDGKWKVKDENGKFSKEYLCWMHMIERCYYDKNKDLHPAYFDKCTVCNEWHNFQTFADWYKENEYKVDERLHLDKDIKFPGNTEYSPNKCMLVPQHINMLFMNKSNKRGLPNGISKCKNGYLAKYGGDKIGIYKTVEEAYLEQTKKKKEEIIRVANEYKGIIPDDVYNAVIAYEFSIENDKNYVA